MAARSTAFRTPCAFVFFFQAEDGIRDGTVTGVQTCALPIWSSLKLLYPIGITIEDLEEENGGGRENLDSEFILARVKEDAHEAYDRREEELTPDGLRELERRVLLTVIDRKWREHLYEMDYLQEGIHLRAYAQQDPLVEYQREAFDMFEALTASIRADFVQYIYRVELVRQEQQPQAPKVQRLKENRDEVVAGAAGEGGGEAGGAGGGAQPGN